MLVCFRLGLETTFFDKYDLEADRQKVVETYCNEDKTENWEVAVKASDKKFIKDMYEYGKENLLRVHVYLRYK